VTSVASLPVIQVSPKNWKVVHPYGFQRGPRSQTTPGPGRLAFVAASRAWAPRPGPADRTNERFGLRSLTCRAATGLKRGMIQPDLAQDPGGGQQ